MKAKIVWTLFMVIGAASLVGQEVNPLPDLQSILARTAAYCDKLRATALKFVCDETIRQTLFFRTEIRSRLGAQVFPLVWPQEDCYRYSYHLLQQGSEIRESRILLEQNNKKEFQENARLYTRFHHQLVVFGPLAFSREQQRLYDYRMVRRLRENGRDVLEVEIAARPGSGAPFVSGTFWIDELDATIHRITLSQECIRGIEIIKRLATWLRATPHVSIVQEYAVLKKGIRFPSRAVLEEDYLRGEKVLQRTLSRIEIEYQNYQFFQVGTTVELTEGQGEPR